MHTQKVALCTNAVSAITQRNVLWHKMLLRTRKRPAPSAPQSRKKRRVARPSQPHKKQHVATDTTAITYITDLLPLNLWLYIGNILFDYISDADDDEERVYTKLHDVLSLFQCTKNPHAAIEEFYAQKIHPGLLVLHPRTKAWPRGGYEIIDAYCTCFSAIVAANTTAITYHTTPTEVDPVESNTTLDIYIPPQPLRIEVNGVDVERDQRDHPYWDCPDLLLIPKNLSHLDFRMFPKILGIVSSTATAQLCPKKMIEPKIPEPGLYKEHTQYIFSDCTKRTLWQDFLRHAPVKRRSLTVMPPTGLQHVTHIKWDVHLREYTIPKNTVYIDYAAFLGSKLTTVDLHWPTLVDIGSSAFEGCKDLACHIVLPDRLQTLPSRCFSRSAIKGITLPKQLRTIEQEALRNTDIRMLTLPSTVQRMKSFACVNCLYLQVVHAEHAVHLKEIPENTFAGCVSLQEITLPAIQLMGPYAFEGCHALKRVCITGEPPCLHIGYHALAQCRSLVNINLPQEYSLGEGAFLDCTKLEGTFELGGHNYPILADNIFMGCTSINRIRIRDQTIRIGMSAFLRCNNLYSAELPTSLQAIDGCAFRECTNLRSIKCGPNLSMIGYEAFRDCTSLKMVTMEATVVQFGEGVFCTCKALGSFTVPPDTCVLPDNTFNGCTALHTVNLSPAIHTLGEACFHDTRSLWDCDFTVLTSLYSIGERMTMMSRLARIDLRKTSVTTLSDSAFQNMTNLQTIHLPHCLEKCGTFLFTDCIRLCSLTFPPGINEIPKGCFSGCVRLQTVHVTTLHQHISMGEKAFANCTRLHNIYFPGVTPEKRTLLIPPTVKKIESEVFSRCNAIQHVAILCPTCDLKTGVFQNMFSLQSVLLGTKCITASMFANCKALKTVLLTVLTTKIDESAFYRCVSLETVTREVSETPLSLGDHTFDGCTRLTALIGVPPLENIPKYCFMKCTSLTALPLHKCRDIGEYAFAFSGLKAVSLPNIRHIWESAFAMCQKLCQFYLGPNLDTLGNRAFEHTALIHLYITDPRICSASTVFGSCSKLKTVEIGDGFVIDIRTPAIYTDLVFPMDYLDHVSIHEPAVIFIPPKNHISLGSNFFVHCRKLESCKLPRGLTVIKTKCFAHCSALISICIPNTVHTIETHTFFECKKLHDLTFVESTTIGLTLQSSAFHTCFALQILDVQRPIQTIGETCFFKCKNLQRVQFYDAVHTLFDRAFALCAKLESIHFGSHPHTDLYIGKAVFTGCSALTDIQLPPVVNTILTYAFFGCLDLSAFTVPTNPTFTTLHADLFHADSVIKELVIPPNVTIVHTSSLDTVKHLTINHPDADIPFVVIDDSERSILQSINYNINAQTLQRISHPATLEQVHFHPALSDITVDTFINCVNLREVDLGNTKICVIPEYGFSGCTSLAKIVLSKQTHTIRSHAFHSCERLTSIVNLYGVHTIEEKVFDGCDSLVYAAFGPKLVHMGDLAFQNCVSLKYVDMSRSHYQVRLGMDIFLDCDALKQIHLPPANTTIDCELFRDLELELVFLPVSLCQLVNPECLQADAIVTLATQVPYLDSLAVVSHKYTPNVPLQ